MSAQELTQNALWAITHWMETGDPKGFPDIRAYLSLEGNHPNSGDQVYQVSGDAGDDQISREDYLKMKFAWLLTEPGKSETFGQESWL